MCVCVVRNETTTTTTTTTVGVYACIAIIHSSRKKSPRKEKKNHIFICISKHTHACPFDSVHNSRRSLVKFRKSRVRAGCPVQVLSRVQVREPPKCVLGIWDPKNGFRPCFWLTCNEKQRIVFVKYIVDVGWR